MVQPKEPPHRNPGEFNRIDCSIRNLLDQSPDGEIQRIVLAAEGA